MGVREIPEEPDEAFWDPRPGGRRSTRRTARVFESRIASEIEQARHEIASGRTGDVVALFGPIEAAAATSPEAISIPSSANVRAPCSVNV
jgi:hypothetical protein